MSAAVKIPNRPSAFIDALVDPGSFLPLTPSAEAYAFGPEVVTGLATCEGRPFALYAIDPAIDRGFVTAAGAQKIERLMSRAHDLGVPIVALLASAGVSIGEGLASGEAYTRVITANIRLSGVIPQIACVLGPTMGAPAYSATLMDLVLFNKARSHLMVTAPAVVARMLGTEPTLAELGGAVLHAEQTGIADFVDSAFETQLVRLRALLCILPSNRLEDAPRHAPRPPRAALPAMPDLPEHAFDMTTLVEALVDESVYLEVGERIGGALVCAFARMGGMPVGIVANQSLVGSGAIDADAARKAARFIRVCDAYNIPIVNLIDVPGFMPGAVEEAKGLLREGARLCTAMVTSVPRLSVVVRKCYGAAAFVMMQSKSQDGDVVLALPTSRIAVMGFDAARHVVYAGSTEDEAVLRARYFATYESPTLAYAKGMIDEIVAPTALRDRLIAHLTWLERKRERPVPERRHAIEP